MSQRRIKQVKRLLRDRAYRSETGLLVLENSKLISEALRRDTAAVQYLLLREDEDRLSGLGDGVSWDETVGLFMDAELVLAAENVVSIDAADFDAIASVETAQGVLAVLKKPVFDWEQHQRLQGLWLVLDGVQDPSNLGAILRNAVAFGVQGVLSMQGSVDMAHPRALRASAGLAMSVPVFEEETAGEYLSVLMAAGAELVLLDGEAAERFSESVYDELRKILSQDRQLLLVLGSEGRGLSGYWDGIPARRLAIAMSQGVESLNVAVASGIVLSALFEA